MSLCWLFVLPHRSPEASRLRVYASVATSAACGLGTDRDTAFRVPESRKGLTAGRSDASVGVSRGCVSVSEQSGSFLQRSCYTLGRLRGHLLGNSHEQEPSANRGLK